MFNRKSLLVGIKAVSDFEQGRISNLMEPFRLNIVERSEGWIVFEGKVGLAKATRILTYLRQNNFGEFYLKGEA